MNNERRIIKASLAAGFTEILFGILMYFTGWGDWYFQRFHFFGTMGICMIFYAYWHLYYYIKETGEGLWTTKQAKK